MDLVGSSPSQRTAVPSFKVYFPFAPLILVFGFTPATSAGFNPLLFSAFSALSEALLGSRPFFSKRGQRQGPVPHFLTCCHHFYLHQGTKRSNAVNFGAWVLFVCLAVFFFFFFSFFFLGL